MQYGLHRIPKLRLASVPYHAPNAYRHLRYREQDTLLVGGRRFQIQILMHQSTKLLSVATAVPPFCLEQSDVAAAAHKGFASRFGAFNRLSRVFDTSGILRRYAVRPLEWYLADDIIRKRLAGFAAAG